jgi:MFS family permease
VNTVDDVSAKEVKPRFSARQRWTLVVIASAVGLDASSVAVVNAALPEIAHDLTIIDSTLQWVMTAYAIAFGGLLLFGGRLTDVFSRRLVFATGVGVFAVGSLLAAVAPTTALLITARVLQGAGAALSMPASTALMFGVFPEGPLRNRALGVYTAVAGGSFSGGLIIGGLLADAFGWRAVFAFTAAFAALVLAATRSTLPRGTTTHKPLDIPGVITCSLGLPLVIFGVNHGDVSGWSDVLTVVALVLGALLLIAFGVRETRTEFPLLPLRIFRSVPTISATVTAFASFGGVLGLMFFVPLYMQNILGFTPLQSALSLLAQSLAVVVFANLTVKQLDKGGSPQRLMATGLVLIGLGLAYLVRTPLSGSYWEYLFPGFLLVGIGVGVSAPSMTGAAMGAVEPEERGVAGGLNATAQQIGTSLGTVILVAVAAAGSDTSSHSSQLHGYHAAYWTATALVIAGALVVIALPGSRRRALRAAADVETTTSQQSGVQVSSNESR